jgi:hypothetical protein
MLNISDGIVGNIPWTEFNVPVSQLETHQLRENHTLRVFNNGILREIFGPKGKINRTIKNHIMKSFIICRLPQIPLIGLNQGGKHNSCGETAGETDGKKLLPKSNSRWQDIVKINVNETGHKLVESIHLVTDTNGMLL